MAASSLAPRLNFTLTIFGYSTLVLRFYGTYYFTPNASRSFL